LDIKWNPESNPFEAVFQWTAFAVVESSWQALSLAYADALINQCLSSWPRRVHAKKEDSQSNYKDSKQYGVREWPYRQYFPVDVPEEEASAGYVPWALNLNLNPH
jgi:hypothetical protein